MFLLLLNLFFTLLAILILLGVIIFLIPALDWLFFVPSEESSVKTIVKLAQPRPGEKAVDLGSGDGRIVIALAQAGIEAHGYEINPLLVWWSRYRIRKAGLVGRAFIHRKNFWQEDLSGFNVVVIYSTNFIMPRLEHKLTQELKPGTKVVTNEAVFPHWQSLQEENKVHLYRR